MKTLRRGLVSRAATARAPSRVAAIAFLLTAAMSCTSYPRRTEAAFREFERGQLDLAEKSYADPETTGAKFLTHSESGMVALAAGAWPRAIDHLSQAADFSKEYENRALVDPEALGEEILSWTINESISTYQGEGFERVMLHASLAIAYLATGDPTGAQVEVRRANALLESEEKLYKKAYKAGGLGHFLSAVSYELQGKSGDAYIDYERMVDKGLAADLAGKALVRLSGELDRKSDREKWVERFGQDEDRPRDGATVVIVAGIGTGPFKNETTITLPGPYGVLQWSVPTFRRRPQPVSDLVFEVGDVAVESARESSAVRTVVVEDVAAVAIENLDDRIAWLAGKSAVRSFLKYALTKKFVGKKNPVGAIAGIVFTLVSERADLRAWQTLPDTWQAARVFLPAGTHRMLLTANGGERVDLGRFELVAGETMFIFGRTIGTRLFAHPIGGRRIVETVKAQESPPATAENQTP